MSTDILTIRLDHTADPDGAQLQTLLAAELAYERARRVRQRWFGILVVAVAANVVAWMSGVSAERVWASALAIAVLAAIAARSALAAFVEHDHHRRWSDALARHPAAVVRPAPDA